LNYAPKKTGIGKLTKDSKAPYIHPRQPAIMFSIDVLSTLVVFYNFTEWGSYSTCQAKMIGLFSFLYLINGWITTWSSLPVYKAKIFFAIFL